MLMRWASLALLVAAACTPEAASEANAVTSARGPGDDPTSCVDDPAQPAKADPVAQDAVMRGIAGLAECAQPGAAPSAMLVVVGYAARGTAETVVINRASTDHCEALECVRHHLAETTVAPASASRIRWAGASFMLRRQPAPDGHEKVFWNPFTETKVCTDDYVARDPPIKPELVRKTMRANYDRLRECYGVGLERDAALRGHVTLRFTITPQGTVSKVRVIENQLPDCEVVHCLADKVGRIVFPSAARPSTIVYPLALEPG